MKDRRQNNERRSEVEKINSLSYELKEFCPKIDFYCKIRKQAIINGIDKLFNYEGYL